MKFYIKNNSRLFSFSNTNYNKHITSKTHVNISSSLTKIRDLMKIHKYDAYVMSNSDPHKNEYLSDKDKKIKFFSKFSGSNALAVITEEKAVLWTDSRYYLQAEKELSKDWQMIPLEKSNLDLKHFLFENNLNTVALDYRNISVSSMRSLRDFFKENSSSINLINDVENISDFIMENGKILSNIENGQNAQNVFIHDTKYSGMSTESKLKLIQENFVKFYTKKIKSCDSTTNYAIIINKLDEIAWLTNLRGLDIPNNPVFFSYAILYIINNKLNLDLYIDDIKLTNISSDYFTTNKIGIKNINAFYSDISDLETNITNKNLKIKIILDKNSCNYSIYDKILSSNIPYELTESNIIEHLKSLKNDTELQGIRNCHIRDGAAIVRYLAWLEKELKENPVSEYEGSQKLFNFRKENELFIEESFDTISSSGENSAVIHYKPEKDSCRLINPNEIYLLDSGGQYLDGTTDTTRTVHFNNPTLHEKEMYTRVLLGNLSIEQLMLNKNKNITGGNIDPIARQFLWRIGEDYGHGTGHGIGHFLNVHEGPQAISPKSNVVLQHGMVTSNEPGFYCKQFGIRIENVLLTLQHCKEEYLCFENVTIVPYEIKLIEIRLLSQENVDIINRYHKQILDCLYGLLHERNDNFAIDYLVKKTQPILL